MNFCPKCGARVRHGARFCAGCGSAVDGGGAFPAGGAAAQMPAAGIAAPAIEPTAPDGPPTDETVIPKSRGKLVGLFFGCLAFVAIAFLIMAADPAGDDWRTSAAPLGILFFGGGAVAAAFMMFRKSPGMVLNSHGFEFLAAFQGTGLVRWSEVAGYRVDSIMFQKMLVVLLKDPDAWCREHGGCGRANLATCGSPVCIPKAAALAGGFDSTVALFGRYFAKYGAGR